jgi:hypothetical protein
MSEYYQNEDVQSRIIEYLGGTSPENATCVYLTRCDNLLYNRLEIHPPHKLLHYFEKGVDICRSLWDRKSLIVHLDTEYVNFDFPAEPYLDLERSFGIQQPVDLAVQQLLLKFGIKPLHLISGRGHHYVWKIRRDSPAFRRTMLLGKLPPHMKDIYSQPRPPNGEHVPFDLGAGFSGLGLIIDYVAFRVKEEAAKQCDLPVQLTAVAAGPGERGREIISIDVSEYGDPLHTRMIRVPYSIYLKPWTNRIPLEQGAAGQIPRLFMIPLHEMDVQAAIVTMQSADLVAELARRAGTKMPDRSDEMENLLSDYEHSDVRKFHDWFYSQEHDPPQIWHRTYDLAPLERLPECVRFILEHPNDLLLKPACIELTLRTMLSLGWHPRHIAGLIRSRYERDYGWGVYWYTYDASSRADFYTRIFSGLFATGQDDLVDYNCISSKEKGICFFPDHGCNLEIFRKSLIERRKHERLAHRPFNRLFLPEEHL